MFSLNNGSIGNDFVQAKVGTDGRFNTGLKELGSDNWFNTIYSWPSDPWSSFTTVKVDGVDLIYGNTPDGQFIQSPTNLRITLKTNPLGRQGILP